MSLCKPCDSLKYRRAARATRVTRAARAARATAALAIACAAASPVFLAAPALAATDIHFDYTSFDNPTTPGASPHFGQNQFNVLNYPSINGNYMMTSTDSQRSQMLANNNNLAE